MVAKITDTRHLLFEDVEVKWNWYESELIRFRALWSEGTGISDLAKEFRTNRRSIALVVMDQAEQGFIRPRRGGLEGGWADGKG